MTEATRASGTDVRVYCLMPQAWEWSSANAHLAGGVDLIVKAGQKVGMCG
jgi:hypothetical protein